MGDFTFDSPFDTPFDDDTTIDEPQSVNVAPVTNVGVGQQTPTSSPLFPTQTSNELHNSVKSTDNSNINLGTQPQQNFNSNTLNTQSVVTPTNPGSQPTQENSIGSLVSSNPQQNTQPISGQQSTQPISGQQSTNTSNTSPQTNLTSSQHLPQLQSHQPLVQQSSTQTQTSQPHQQSQGQQTVQPQPQTVQTQQMTTNTPPSNPTAQLTSALDQMTIEEKLAFLQQQQQLLMQQQQELLRQQQAEVLRKEEEAKQQEEQKRQEELKREEERKQQELQKQQEELKREEERKQQELQKHLLIQQQQQQQTSQIQPQQTIVQTSSNVEVSSQQNVSQNQTDVQTQQGQTNNQQPETKPTSPTQKSIDLNDPNTIWKEAKAPNGRTYYYNKVTKQTTWQRPPGFTGYQPSLTTTTQGQTTNQTTNQTVQTTNQTVQTTSPRVQTTSTEQSTLTNSTNVSVNSGLVSSQTSQDSSSTNNNQVAQQQTTNQTGQPQFNHLFQSPVTSNGSDLTASVDSIPGNPSPTTTNTSPTEPVESTPTLPKFLKVRLPEDQRQVVKFRPEQTLRSVLSKICASRPFSEEDYIPKDKSGNNLDIELTLGELNQEEISFIVPREGFKPRDETEKKAQNVMAEIYQANASLSSTLFTILKNYRDPLLESARDPDQRKRVLSENQCNQIFSSLESIAKACKEFNLALAPQLEKWPLDLTTLFRDHMSVVPYYMNYVNNYKSAMGTLEELRINKMFADQVDGIQKASGNKLRLEELLSLPALKLSKLVELIEMLCEILGDTHVDYMTLKEFHQRLIPHKLTAEKLRREYEARNKLLYIQANVTKLPKRQNLLHEQRCFFREGIFDVETKKSKQAPYYVYLFTDFLVLCKFEKKAKKPISYTFFDIINFVPRQTIAEEVPSSSYSFVIQVDDPKKGKLIYTCTITNQTEGTKTDWMTSIKDAVDDFNSKPDLHNK